VTRNQLRVGNTQRHSGLTVGAWIYQIVGTMTWAGPAELRQRGDWTLPILVGLCAVVAYVNSFSGPFIYDDIDAIRDNPQIRSLLPFGAKSPASTTLTGRPVLRLSFAVDYAIGGLHVQIYHATNLLIHVGAGLLLYGIVRRNLLNVQFWGNRGSHFPSPGNPGEGQGEAPIRRSEKRPSPQPSPVRLSSPKSGVPGEGVRGSVGPFLAAAVAAVWVMHPLNTEAVTLVVQRAESLAGFCYLAVIYCLIRAAQTGRAGPAWSIGAVVCCAMGMATKEVMVTAPLMALLYDRTFLAGSFSRALRERWRLYAGLAATWIMLAALVHAAGNRGGTAGYNAGISVHDYARTQLAVVAHYLLLVVWPKELVLDYGWPIAHGWGEVGWSGALMAALAVGSIVALVCKPWLGFLGAWFFGILLPSSSFVPVVTEVAAEHRMYLPLMAPIALAVVGAWVLTRRHGLAWLVWASAALAITMGTWRTLDRNAEYHSGLRIWQLTVAQRPLNARAHYNLGHSWKEIAEAMPPGSPEQLDAAHHALDEFRVSLKLQPHSFGTAQALAEALMDVGDYPDSERAFDILLGLDPSLLRGHVMRGKLRILREDWPAAASDFEAAITATPDQPEPHYYLGVCCQQMHQWKRAQTEFERALALSPGGFRDTEQRLARVRVSQTEN
jgi:tetratricopeptide (TPR) repeat protein